MAKRILVRRGFVETATGQALASASHLFTLQPKNSLPADIVMPGIGIMLVDGTDLAEFDPKAFHRTVSNGFKYSFLLVVKPRSLEDIELIQERVSLKTQVLVIEHEAEVVELMQLVCNILAPKETQAVNEWLQQNLATRLDRQAIYRIAATMPIQPNEARVLMDSVGSLRQLASLDGKMLLEKTPLSDRHVNTVVSFLHQ